MIIHEFNILDIGDQINDDLVWIDEIINQPGQMFTDVAKLKAKKLKEYITEHSQAIEEIKQYVSLRDDVLNSVHETDKNIRQNQLNFLTKLQAQFEG